MHKIYWINGFPVTPSPLEAVNGILAGNELLEPIVCYMITFRKYLLPENNRSCSSFTTIINRPTNVAIFDLRVSGENLSLAILSG